MKTMPSLEEYITLEGDDYNARRLAEALARVEFGRPENHELRCQFLKTLFPKLDDAPLHAVAPEPEMPRKLL